MRSEGHKIESEGRESGGWVLGEGQQAIMLFTAAGICGSAVSSDRPTVFHYFQLMKAFLIIMLLTVDNKKMKASYTIQCSVN